MLKSLCLWLKLCSSMTGTAYAIDGDTLSLMGTHIRLWGVDAEELSEPHGHQAKTMLQSLINQGITCELTGEKSYNRQIGACYSYADGTDVGAELIRLGFALDCAHYSGGKYRSLEPLNSRSKLIQKPYCK